jgi:hypothetical protein
MRRKLYNEELIIFPVWLKLVGYLSKDDKIGWEVAQTREANLIKFQLEDVNRQLQSLRHK